MSRTASNFFKGRSVVITGGSSGLGLALAQALAAREAQLILVARGRRSVDRRRAEHLRAPSRGLARAKDDRARRGRPSRTQRSIRCD